MFGKVDSQIVKTRFLIKIFIAVKNNKNPVSEYFQIFQSKILYESSKNYQTIKCKKKYLGIFVIKLNAIVFKYILISSLWKGKNILKYTSIQTLMFIF